MLRTSLIAAALLNAAVLAACGDAKIPAAAALPFAALAKVGTSFVAPATEAPAPRVETPSSAPGGASSSAKAAEDKTEVTPEPEPLQAPAAPPPQAKPADPAPSAASAKEGFKLGVVNLKTCFERENYTRIKDVDVELKAKSDELQKKSDDLLNQMSILKQKLTGVDPGQQPTLFQKLKRELVLKEAELKYQKEVINKSEFLDYYGDKKIEVYNAIRKAVELIAKEQGFDLVLRVETPLLEEGEQEGISSKIASRVVLYNNDAVDITPVVLKRLNQEYEKEKALKAVAAGAEWECKECKKKNKGDTCTATKDCKGKKP